MSKELDLFGSPLPASTPPPQYDRLGIKPVLARHAIINAEPLYVPYAIVKESKYTAWLFNQHDSNDTT